MPSPHDYLLQEFKISIDKLVPLTPQAVIDEANKIYAELSSHPAVTEQQIRQALVLVGRKEFPYRKAYEELCANDEEQRLQVEVFKRLEPAIAEKLKQVTDNGVHVLDYVKSKLFERELEPTERYQVDQAILLAHDVLNQQCDDRAKARQQNFETLVERWREHETKLQNMLDQLRGLAERSPENSAEIKNKADQLEEGWSIVEPDPKEEEIKHEIESWMTVLEEGENE